MDRRQFVLSSVTVALGLSSIAAQRDNKRPGATRANKRPTREELVRVRTKDDLEQSGLLVSPVGPPLHPVAVIWIHGAGANLYFPSYVEIARATASLGYPFITGNTRMHDIGSVLADRADGAVRGGTYWGLPSKEPLDVAAWITFAQTRGYPSVVLVGHSAGGPAVRRYMAEHPDGRVIGWVMASVGLGLWPPKADGTPLLKTALEMVANGHGQDFLPTLRLSAATFVDYAQTPDDIYDFYGIETPQPAIVRVRSPLLAWYGSKDIGTAADLERLRALIARHPNGPARVDTLIVENADHEYVGQEPQIAQPLANWISKLSALSNRDERQAAVPLARQPGERIDHSR